MTKWRRIVDSDSPEERVNLLGQALREHAVDAKEFILASVDDATKYRTYSWQEEIDSVREVGIRVARIMGFREVVGKILSIYSDMGVGSCEWVFATHALIQFGELGIEDVRKTVCDTDFGRKAFCRIFHEMELSEPDEMLDFANDSGSSDELKQLARAALRVNGWEVKKRWFRDEWYVGSKGPRISSPL